MVANLMTNIPARDAYVNTVQALTGRVTAVAVGGPATLSVKIGTLPAGATILSIVTNVETVIAGTTPTFNLGTGAGATGTGIDIAASIALTAGSVTTAPLAALVMPFAVDTDVWANITGTPTAGDAYVIVTFVKPSVTV